MRSEKIIQAMEQGVTDAVFSGAQLVAGKGEQNLFHGAFGHLSYQNNSSEIREDTLFDVASLTKPVSTLNLAMIFYQKGMYQLSDSICKFIPELEDVPWTIEQLLAHRSGLPSWIPLRKNLRPEENHIQAIRENFLKQIQKAPFKALPGGKRIYSDLGYILLGFFLEKIGGEPLDILFDKHIAKELSLEHSLFRPNSKNTAMTEDCPWRQKILQGEVHDDHAYLLGKMAGHAGLFSTALDLEKYVHEIWKVLEGKSPWLKQETFEIFLNSPSGWVLGWDTVEAEDSQAGRYFSIKTIGHLAFTGCSFWLDRKDQKYIILVTNRVHPTAKNEGIKAFRPKIHDLVVGELISPPL